MFRGFCSTIWLLQTREISTGYPCISLLITEFGVLQEVNTLPSSTSCPRIPDFPILSTEICKFQSGNALNYEFNYLFDCRIIFDIVGTFRFLELPFAHREFRV